MIILNLERCSRIPLYRQVLEGIKGLVDGGALKPGDRLPATRMLAQTHGLHRSTVYKAYEELWAQGYIESRPGSYSVVRRRESIATFSSRQRRAGVSWSLSSTPRAVEAYSFFTDWLEGFPPPPAEGLIDLSKFELDKRLFPAEEFRRCMNRVLSVNTDVFEYGDPAGYAPLREFIASRLRIHGITVTADEIIVTNGSQNGIDLVLKFLAGPGSRVLVESPTYVSIIPLLRFYETEVVEIPMTDEGLDLDALRGHLELRPASFLYTMPNFHNPTGVTTSQCHREKLLRICREHRLPVVEDAFEEEMKYYGKVPLPIKSMDCSGIVIYLGTFSKILFPGIRMGWIAADAGCVRRILAIKKFSDLASSMVVQAVLAEFCREGGYELHIRRMHRVYRKRMQAALDALARYMPAGRVRWREPVGGYLIWLQLDPLPVGEKEFLGEVSRDRVYIKPGRFYFPGRTMGDHVRLCISSLDEDEITEGIRRLGRALSRIYGRT